MTITQFINGPRLVTQSLLFLPLTHTHTRARTVSHWSGETMTDTHTPESAQSCSKKQL